MSALTGSLTALRVKAVEDNPKLRLSSKGITGGGLVKAWNDAELIQL